MTDQHQPLEKVDDDYISNLPDDILCLILLFLSMRDATKTRSLSRRWRYLSSSALNLHFHLISILGIRCDWPRGEAFLKWKSKFIMGVNQFLLHFHSGPKKIDAFEVTFALGNESQLHIDKWVGFALDRETAMISLNLSSLPKGVDLCKFPCHLLPCRSHCLKHLRLISCILAPSPDYAKRLSSLVTLSLKCVRLDEVHLDSILSGCLNLEILELKRCSLPNNLCISGPFLPLKSLTLFLCDNQNHHIMTLELNSLEKLTTFMYSGCMGNFVFVDVPALKIVFFRHFVAGSDPYLSVLGREYVFSKLAEDLRELQLLTLVFHPFDVLVIPKGLTFRHLKQLELSISVSPRYDLLNIISILHASPALQKFQFAYRYNSDHDVTIGKEVECIQQPHFELEEVEIFGFYGTSNEMDLVFCLLNCCIALKLLAVNEQGKHIPKPGRWIDRPNSLRQLNREAIQDLFSQQRLIIDSGVEIIIS